MRIQKSAGKSAKCRICMERIKDDYRLYAWVGREIAFFHIDCIIRAGRALSTSGWLNRMKQGGFTVMDVRDL